MRIRKIHIKNLKSVANLEISFDKAGKKNEYTEPQVALLYGNNGVGKTTILEAISLIGHISCMRMLKLQSTRLVQQHSVLVEEIRKGLPNSRYGKVQASNSLPTPEEENVFDNLTDLFKFQGYQTLTEWFEKFVWDEGATNAAIRYELDTGLDIGELVFFIYFIQKPRLSITQALSRRTYDDSQMNNLFAILYEDSQRQNPSRVPEFIRYMHGNSSYLIKKNRDDEKPYLIPKANDGAQAGLVSFINTDLNDFGRINDIRESVKDIQKSLHEEITERLALPFDGKDDNGKPDNSFRNLKELRVIIEDVIQEYSNFDASKYYENYPVKKEEPPFKIDILRLNSTKTDIEFVPKRRGKPLLLDYMSAGENECFFIFLILLGLPKKSIILLDEPDLHLTTFAKSNFFKRLYSVIASQEYQVIIATHTLFSNPGNKMWIKDSNGIRKELEFDGKVILRREKKLIDRTDELLTYQFLKHYVKTALRSLRVVSNPRVARKLLSLWVRDFAKWAYEHKLDPAFILGVLGFLMALVGFPISFLNDRFEFIEHTELFWITLFMVIGGFLLIILGIIVWFGRTPKSSSGVNSSTDS